MNIWINGNSAVIKPLSQHETRGNMLLCDECPCISGECAEQMAWLNAKKTELGGTLYGEGFLVTETENSVSHEKCLAALYGGDSRWYAVLCDCDKIDGKTPRSYEAVFYSEVSDVCDMDNCATAANILNALHGRHGGTLYGEGYGLNDTANTIGSITRFKAALWTTASVPRWFYVNCSCHVIVETKTDNWHLREKTGACDSGICQIALEALSIKQTAYGGTLYSEGIIVAEPGYQGRADVTKCRTAWLREDGEYWHISCQCDDSGTFGNAIKKYADDEADYIYYYQASVCETYGIAFERIVLSAIALHHGWTAHLSSGVLAYYSSSVYHWDSGGTCFPPWAFPEDPTYTERWEFDGQAENVLLPYHIRPVECYAEDSDGLVRAVVSASVMGGETYVRAINRTGAGIGPIDPRHEATVQMATPEFIEMHDGVSLCIDFSEFFIDNAELFGISSSREGGDTKVISSSGVSIGNVPYVRAGENYTLYYDAKAVSAIVKRPVSGHWKLVWLHAGEPPEIHEYDGEYEYSEAFVFFPARLSRYWNDMPFYDYLIDCLTSPTNGESTCVSGQPFAMPDRFGTFTPEYPQIPENDYPVTSCSTVNALNAPNETIENNDSLEDDIQ